MNPELYSQGTPFVQVPRQKTQPITALANPTSYHLQQREQRELRNQKQLSNDGTPGAPPTPNNSFQSNVLNSFSNSTIDPQILNRQQQFRYMNPIKHESEFMEDFDPSSTVMSPMSNSCGGSPQNNSYGSPPNHIYGAGAGAGAEDTFGRSFKPTSHLDSLFESSGNTPLYPTTNIDNLEYGASYVSDDFQPLSAPNSSSAIDVKTNVNNNNPKVNFRHPHNNLGQISMSLPVFTNSDADGWQPYGSLDFPSNTNMSMLNSNFIDADENDTQKAAALFEKRRRRRESHNAVERRRRDNINEKIQELSTLLPDLYVDSANKPNKGVILRKSVDYIRHLKHIIDQEKNRNIQLESQVRELSKPGMSPIDNNSGSASNRSELSGGDVFGSPHASSLS